MMAVFTIQAPDGRRIKIEAVDQATAMRGAQEWAAANPAEQAAPSGPMITVGDRKIPVAEYQAMSNDERQAIRSQIAQANPSAQTQSDLLDTFAQGATFGWGDEARGVVQGGLAALQGGDFNSARAQVEDEARNAIDQERRVNPAGAFASELAGGLVTGAGAGGQLAAKGATLGARALTGLGVGAGQGAAYGAGASNEDRVAGALVGGGLGGAIGAAAPFIGNAIQNRLRAGAQNRAIDAAIADAPSAQSLRENASQIFDSIRQSNTSVANQKVRDFVTHAGDTLRNLGADRDITPAGIAVFRRMVEDLGGEVSLPKLHIWRQLASNAAMGKGGDVKMGTTLVRLIDDFIDGLKPGDLQLDAALTQGPAKSIPNAFFEAISTYRRAAKMSTLEQAIAKAAEYQSGFESGLRNQFSNILRSPSLSRGFTEAEKEAMRRISRGTGTSNLLRFLGTFGVPTDQARNWLGALASGSIGGAVGGLPGAAAMLGLGTAARAGSSRLMQNAADRAVRVVATPNIPSLPPVNRALPSPVEELLRRISAPTAGQIGN